jgi:hypothetical protein
MQKVLNKYFSFFFLFLFLFPMVEKQLHALAHADEVHCSADEKHFHELEHSCSICDFNLTDSPTLTSVSYSFIIIEVENTYDTFIEGVNTSLRVVHLPARAPPIA